jgi:hypothetical protein
MKYRFLFIVVIFVCIIPSPVLADAVQGEQLLFWLTGQSPSEVEAFMNKAKSMAYVQGMLDLYVVLSHRDPGLKIYCVPDEGISIGQAKDIIVKWLNAHPKRMKEEARILVLYALRDAFPCN